MHQSDSTGTLAATIIIPTTGDRRAVLEYSIASALSQTVENIECFVIGDGVDKTTDDYLVSMSSRDARLSFFRHPKHARRGEIYRHQALHQARGTIVSYLCDRDLLLPSHIEHHMELLQNNDIAVSMGIAIDSNGKTRFLFRDFFSSLVCSGDMNVENKFQLSAVSHTLSAYKNLPHGWRTTPSGTPTDQYMWEQFTQQPACRIVSSPKPTFLYFKRGNHPGLSSALRAKELKKWNHTVNSPSATAEIYTKAVANNILDFSAQSQMLEKTPVLIFGRTPTTLIRQVITRLRSRVF